MKKRILTPLFLLFSVALAFSQSDSTNSETSSIENKSTPAKETAPETGFVFKPTIGLGTGMFSFYGDLYTKNFQAPMVSRIGYDLSVSQRFTDYLQLNFYVLYGKLGANERIISSGRYLNFESQIRVGGLSFLYNFGNFLPSDRQISPYVSLGIESFEFLSKTDLLDKSGNTYNYWSDGTIRNMPENDPMAANAIEITRDYTYESDIRE
ncbi:MAG: hypothetical protein M3R27_15735, partial [Bacteroidota bacterium]|nr:hypothetical protein [Bacteroidota bacterium]